MQMVVADAEILTDGDILAGVTVTLKVLLVAVVGFAQANELVITTLIALPFVSDVVENIGLFVPVLTPFTCH